MATTRDRALDAAVEVVADGGMRALTHARVDARAGLPPGSTSNWFRTRDALVTGLVDWIAEQERKDYRVAQPESVGDVIDALTRMIEVQTTRHAARTRARFILFLDGRHDTTSALRRQRVVFERWLQEIAITLGMPDPVAAARTILACGSGLVMHRLTVDPGAPVRPSVERAVRGCLGA